MSSTVNESNSQYESTCVPTLASGDQLNADNDVQPDLCMRRECGSAWLDDEEYLHGSPELIVEVAGSSASFDFGEKRDAYGAASIGEYLVFETHKGRIVWWYHLDGQFVAIEPDQSILRSRSFPGLWMDVNALHESDGRRIIDTLHRGMRESGSDATYLADPFCVSNRSSKSCGFSSRS